MEQSVRRPLNTAPWEGGRTGKAPLPQGFAQWMPLQEGEVLPFVIDGAIVELPVFLQITPYPCSCK